MDKPKQPDGTYKDWLRYRAELAVWEYFTRYGQYQRMTEEARRG